MDKTLDLRIIEIKGIDPKALEVMGQELKHPSSSQKITEEIYSLREENTALKNQVTMLKDERVRLKRSVESAISIIIGTAYEKVNNEGKIRLDKFRKEAAETLKISDILGMLIGE